MNSDLTVMAGPFKGMHYVENSIGGAYFPKLLGTYEKELEPVLKDLGNTSYERIVNVGAGEGYFTVGLGRMFSKADIIAFEPNFMSCHLLQRMAEMNNVRNRLTIHCQLCDVQSLRRALQPEKQSLVFMDVEGAELFLLDPDQIPELKKAAIVVEIHDNVAPDLGDRIKDRFKSSHTFTEIWQQDRSAADLPYKPAFLTDEYVKLLDEGRGMRMRWFYFKPL